MSIAFLYWLVMILWLLFGFWVASPAPAPRPWFPYGGHLILWILLFMLGWRVFGFPIHP